MKVENTGNTKVASRAEERSQYPFISDFYCIDLPTTRHCNSEKMKLVLTVSFLLSAVQGSQDSAYYPGFSNPNTQDTMYYRDASNVLQGVKDGDFSALYIKYHGCV